MSLSTHDSLGSPNAVPGIDLRTILRVLRYWAWLLLTGALFGAGLGYAASLQSLPIYRTDALMLIEETRPFNNSEINISDRTSTYLELVNEGFMLEVIALTLQVNYDQLADTITAMRVEAVNNTQLFRVTVEGFHPDSLAAVANALPRVLQQEIAQVRTERFTESRENLTTQIEMIKAQTEVTQANIDRIGVARSAQQENQLRDLQTVLAQQQNSYANLVQSFENLRLVELQALDNIAVLRPAAVPTAPVSSNTAANALLGALVGLALVTTVITLIEYLDDRVHSPEILQEMLGTAFLGAIAEIRTQTSVDHLDAKLIAAVAPRDPVTEAYRAIRTNLRFTTIDKTLRTLIITSANSGEGKSLTTANLAVVMAQLGLSVILIDADLRKPTQHRLFHLAQQPGLSNALLATNQHPHAYLQTVALPNLSILTSGIEPPNPADLLGSQQMKRLLEQLQEQADVILLDMPPLLAVTDAAVLASSVQDILLVVNAKRTPRAAVTRAVAVLQRVDAHLCGVILNEFSHTSRSYAYYEGYKDIYYKHSS